MRPIGHYELVEPLGRGSSGIVWRARSTSGADVALKVLYDSVAHDVVSARRFLASGRLLRDVPIEGAVPVVDALEADVHAAIAMELIDAPSLRDLIAEGRCSPAR